MPRSAFCPTDDQRRLVKFAVAIGTPLGSIAEVIGLRSVKGLNRHFRNELARGAPEANAKVCQTLLQMATSGKSLAATRHWLTRQPGWEEKPDGVEETVHITSAEMIFVDPPEGEQNK